MPVASFCLGVLLADELLGALRSRQGMNALVSLVAGTDWRVAGELGAGLAGAGAGSSPPFSASTVPTPTVPVIPCRVKAS